MFFDFREMSTIKLVNSGGAPGPEQNICFINAVLNLLFSLPVFRNFFQKKLYARKGNRQKLSICEEISAIFNCVGARTSAGSLRAVMGSLSPKFEYIKNVWNCMDMALILVSILSIFMTVYLELVMGSYLKVINPSSKAIGYQ